MTHINLRAAQAVILNLFKDSSLPYFDTVTDVNFEIYTNRLVANILGLNVPNTNCKFNSFDINIIGDSLFVDFMLKNVTITTNSLKALNKFNTNALYHTAYIDDGYLHVHFGTVGLLDTDDLVVMLPKGIFEFLMKDYLVNEVVEILNEK